MCDRTRSTTVCLAVMLGLAAAALRGEERTATDRAVDGRAVDGRAADAAPAGGSQPKTSVKRLSDVSLEELMNIEVSSVSRKEQKLNQTAAAVFVITQEDIRRSGATSVPEALRMAPGVQVSQIDGNKWAIAARGFDARFANKMLVLIDGRSVYNILYSGVYWDQNDVMMEDIERIEVIRGPGATMWGANAVNGVINIITKSSKETQGNLISTTAGNIERPSISARHGGKIGSKATYRTYTKYFSRGNMAQPNGREAYDGWNSLRGGGRVDWEINSRDSFTAQGDVYRETSRQSYYSSFPIVGIGTPARADVHSSGGFGSARWRRTLSDSGDLTVQAYYDSTRRTEFLGDGSLDTGDIDVQHHQAIGARHDIVWGGGYRFVRSRITPLVNGFMLNPPVRNDHLFSAFFQDEIGLIPSRLTLTVGTKLQHNSYTGFEVQPSVRLIYLATQQQSLWAAVSRAVRTPSRIDHDLHWEYTVAGGPAGVYGLLAGDRTNPAEGVISYEAGYRNQPWKRMSIDVAAFYGRYDHMKDLKIEAPYFQMTPEPRLLIPAMFSQTAPARNYGAELTTMISPAARWKLHTGYSWITVKQRGSTPLIPVLEPSRTSPRHMAQVRSLVDVTRRLSFDTSLYYSSALRGLSIPSYARLDTRLGWRLSEQLELSVMGQNLLDDQHLEFRSEDYVVASEIRRAFLIRLLWLF